MECEDWHHTPYMCVCTHAWVKSLPAIWPFSSFQSGWLMILDVQVFSHLGYQELIRFQSCERDQSVRQIHSSCAPEYPPPISYVYTVIFIVQFWFFVVVGMSILMVHNRICKWFISCFLWSSNWFIWLHVQYSQCCRCPQLDVIVWMTMTSVMGEVGKVHWEKVTDMGPI